MKRFSRYMTIGWIALSSLLACTASSPKSKTQPGPGLLEPPLGKMDDCRDAELFWPDAALVPLQTELRKSLSTESEHWLGTIDNAIVCRLLRPSCAETAYPADFFQLVCPGEAAPGFLDPKSDSAQRLELICRQKDAKSFHSCQEVLTDRLLQKTFDGVSDRPRFYKLKE